MHFLNASVTHEATFDHVEGVFLMSLILIGHIMRKPLSYSIAALLAASVCPIAAMGQSQVIVSQYIETNSGTTPKGIEIFNVSGSDITFSAGNNLQVYQGTNGAACTAIAATNITSGTLAADEVWVIGTPDLTTYATNNGTGLSGTTDYNFSYNGDDALQLYLGGTLQDVFGTCGNDPGSAWSGGGVSTANNNIQLKTGICTGSLTNWTDPSARFDQIANGSTMTGFGNPPVPCAPPSGPVIMVSPASLSGFSTPEGTLSASQTFTVSGDDLTGNLTLAAVGGYEYSTDDASFSSTLNIPVSSGDVAGEPLTIYVRLTGAAQGSFSGNAAVSGGGATTQNVALDGTVTAPPAAPCSELFISEYVEGSSSNKYIEIYNPTSSAVNLGTGNYSLRLYANGATTPTNDVALSGTVPAYGTVVYRNGSATVYGGTATVNAAVNFSGDDALALAKNGVNIDIFGVIGEDPGSQWNIGGNGTAEQTLVRNADVEVGVNVNPGTFATLGTDWTEYGQDDVSDLGSHTCDCFVPNPEATISINTPIGTEDDETSITLTISTDVPVTGDQTVQVTLSVTGLTNGDFTGVTFPVTVTILNGQDEATVTFTVNDDSDVEGDETATFTIGSPSSGLNIGTPSSVSLDIDDNDNVTSTVSAVITQGGEPATIPSLTNGTITTNTDGVQVWHFRLYDGDGSGNDADDKPTRYSGFTIRPAAGNTVADWDAAINDVEFFRDAEATPVFGGGVLTSASTITFSIPSAANHINVADNGFVDIYMRLTLENTLPSGSDGQHFAFSIDDDDVNVNTDALTYSQLGTFTATSDAADNEIDILATLQFIDAPTTVSVGSNFSITVSAIDVNGNVDVDVTSAITLAQTGGAGTLSGTTTANLVNGTYTFAGLNHDTEELIEVTASGGSYSSVSANLNVVDQPYQLFDDFNRADNNTVGIPSSGGVTPWNENESGNGSKVRIENQMLRLSNCNSDATGGSEYREQIMFDVASKYETVFDDAGSTLEWVFNMRQDRSNPSGFNDGNYAAAVVLGANQQNVGATGANGYAVVIGNAGDPDPVRLVRFTNGLTSNTNVTNVAVSSQTNDENFFSIRVTFDPCDGEWALYVRDDGGSAFAAPNSGSLGTPVTATDQTHTALDLRYFGMLWNHQNSCTETATFDNVNIPNAVTASTTAKVWNGSVNNNWNEPNNWGPCPGVPTQTNDVIVPNVAIQPVISASPAAYCKDLTIDAGADLTINAGQFLNAWGDVVNNGNAAFGAGTFTMEGGATATLNGNVNVANFHVSSPVTLNGTVTVSNIARSEVGGALNANGNLVILSGAQLLHGTGTPSGGGTVTGNIVVRRQGNASSTVYNYWSTPVVGGILPGSNGYQYNSTAGTLANGDDNVGTGDPGWSSFSGAMTPGRGYASTGGGLASFVGPANDDDIPYGVTVAPGTPFNLVGNPYPSAISADDFIAVNGPSGTGRIAGALYFWDDDLSASTNYWTDDYAVWTGVGAVGGGGNTPNGSVATGQGFKVEALSAGTVQFNNSMRGGTNTQFFKLVEESEMDRLWLNLSGNDLFNQALTVFIDDATEQRDALYDAYKVRGNADISLAMMQEEESFAVVAFPPLTIDRVVPLQTYVSQTGVYTFEADSVDGFSGFTIYLEDLHTGQLHELVQGSEVEVQLSSQDEFGRFQLRFSPSLITGVEEGAEGLSRIISNGHGIQVHASADVNTRGEFRLFNTAGQLLLSRNISVSNGRSEWLDVSSLSSGIYLAEFLSPNGVVNAKVLLH